MEVDVKPRVVFLTKGQSKALVLTVWSATFLGSVAVLVILLLRQYGTPDVFFLQSNDYLIVNICLSSVFLLLLAFAAAMYTYRMYLAAKVMPIRFWYCHAGGRHMMLTATLLIVQWITLLTCLIPSALVLANKCWYRDAADFGASETFKKMIGFNVTRLISHSTFFLILCVQVGEMCPATGYYPAWYPTEVIARIRKWRKKRFSRIEQNADVEQGFDGGIEGAVEGVFKGLNGQTHDVPVASKSKRSGMLEIDHHDGDSQLHTVTPSTKLQIPTYSERRHLSHTKVIADGSLWHHFPFFVLWLAFAAVAITQNAIASQTSDHISFSVGSTETMLAKYEASFGADTMPVWKGIARQPNERLGNLTVRVFNGSFHTASALFTGSLPVWNTAWIQPSQIPLCKASNASEFRQPLYWHSLALEVGLPEVLPMAVQPNCTSAAPSGLTALWQVGFWLYALRETWFSNYCNSDMTFDEVYHGLIAQGAHFRRTVGLPEHCDGAWDPTCSFIQCPVENVFLALTITATVLQWLYVFGFVYRLYKALLLLRKMPYMTYRVPQAMVHMQARESLVVIVFYSVALTMSAWIGWGDCNNLISITFGLIPAEFVASVLVMSKSFATAPIVDSDSRHTDQMQLSMFAWSEDSVEEVLAVRGHRESPVFVMETALKCLYYSIASYRIFERDAGPTYPIFCFRDFDMGAVLQMDGFTDHKIIQHPALDVVVLAGWNGHHLMLAFRGTSSLANVKADVAAVPILHYNPAVMRHSRVFGTRRAAIHKGFGDSWLKVRQEVLELVMQRLQATRRTHSNLLITCTGHSLGGAQCTLAAYDISLLLRDFPTDAYHIRTYTYGCPRAGNHAFADIYKAAVPDTWDVANDQDVVPKMTKWLRLYKRDGERVMIHSRKVEGKIMGDIIVRPTYFEMGLLQHAFRNSIKNHLTGSYCATFGAIVASQFDEHKALPGGRAGATKLLQTTIANTLLQGIIPCELLTACQTNRHA